MTPVEFLATDNGNAALRDRLQLDTLLIPQHRHGELRNLHVACFETACGYVYGALLRPRQRDALAGLEVRFHIQGLGESFYRGGDAIGRTHDYPHRYAIHVERGDLFRRVVVKCRSDLLVLLRQCQPQLQSVQAVWQAAHLIALALGVDDALPCHHQVDITGADRLQAAEGVPVQYLALKQVGDRADTDMRVRAHIDALPGGEIRGPHMIEEDPWPDHLLLSARQGAPHREPAQLLRLGLNQLLDGATALDEITLLLRGLGQIAHSYPPVL